MATRRETLTLLQLNMHLMVWDRSLKYMIDYGRTLLWRNGHVLIDCLISRGRIQAISLCRRIKGIL